MTEVIFYVSNSRIGVIRPDGTGECYPVFTVPTQASWQLGYLFPNGRQAILSSQEPPKNPNAAFSDPDGLAFAKTHLWRYDFVTEAIQELALPSYASIIGMLPTGDRWLVLRNTNNIAGIYIADLEGGACETCWSSPGYAYGASLSPEGRRVAFHVTGATGGNIYDIVVVNLASHRCTLIASDPDYLNFAPAWSPDGEWLLYQRCAFRDDPGHDHSDLCISRADGSEYRLLTSGQSHWFAAAYGTPARHSSGSNIPAWSPDGRHIACTLLLPAARTAWPYRVGQPDTDHFNRDYRPEQAHGGTQVCLIDWTTGIITPITHDDPPAWYVRPAWSPDGTQLAVGRAEVGELAAMWVMDADGDNSRRLTCGIDGLGADHFRWRRLAATAAAHLCQLV